jgi:site-specific recombinase XerD
MRSKGDGTLFKRKDGYWVGGIELPPGPDGKRRYKRVVRKSRNDAIAELRKIKVELDAGRITTAATTTVEKWMDYWQREILPHRNLKPETNKTYRTTIRLYIVPYIGALRLDRLHPADIRTLYVNLQADVSTRAAQKAHQVLCLALKAAVRDELIAGSVMDRVDKPAHAKKASQAFDAPTTLHLLNTAARTQGEMWTARWMLGLATGLRESELLGLEWDRVHLDRAVIDCAWQMQRLQKAHGCGEPVDDDYPCGYKKSAYCPGAEWNFPAGMQWRECTGTLVWTRPKTKAGTRMVPLVPGMGEVLRTLAGGPNPHNLVFHHPDGRPFTQDQDQRMWRKLLKDAEIPHVPQHTIRHTTVSLLLDAGADSYVVESVIGHSDIATTRDYQHVSLELARRAWSSLEPILPTSSDSGKDNSGAGASIITAAKQI